MKLRKDEPMDPVVLNKASHRIRPMLVDAEDQVAGHADIKGPIASARKDVDAWALLHHVRRRVSGSSLRRALGPRFRGDDEYHFSDEMCACPSAFAGATIKLCEALRARSVSLLEIETQT